MAADYIGTVADYIEADLQVNEEEKKKKPKWLEGAEKRAEAKEGKLKESEMKSFKDFLQELEESTATHALTGHVTGPDGHTKDWALGFNGHNETPNEMSPKTMANRLRKHSESTLSHDHIKAIVHHFNHDDAGEQESNHKGHNVYVHDEVSRLHEGIIKEYESDKNGVYRHTKKASYGTSYNDPEGEFESKDDMKKATKKAAGRKTGQSVGSYKRRQPKNDK
jgi:hypothetical protein